MADYFFDSSALVKAYIAETGTNWVRSILDDGKVLSFLKEHENHIALQKLRRNIPITASDISELERILFESGEVGTKEVFEKAYGKQEQLGLFIRKMIGLDRQAAKRAFRDYLEDKTLTANQIRFIDLVVDYLTKKRGYGGRPSL